MNNSAIDLILLDRDGVINHESSDFIKSPDEWQPIDSSLEAIAALQEQYTVAVCTNQSGLARGLFSLTSLHAIHTKLQSGICAVGGKPLEVFFCPHLDGDNCLCRKPKPGLLVQAMAQFSAAPSHTLFVGDSKRDIEAAQAAG